MPFVNPFANETPTSPSAGGFVNPFANETPQQTGDFAHPIVPPVKAPAPAPSPIQQVTNFGQQAGNFLGNIVNTVKTNAIDIASHFPQLTQELANLQQNPLSLKNGVNSIKSPLPVGPQLGINLDIPKMLGDAVNTIKTAASQESQRINDAFKTFNSPAPTSKKVAVGISAVSGGANVALAPVSAFFSAANDIPVLGTASRLLTLPFTAIGEGVPKGTNKIIDALPIPEQVKTNLKPAIGEITALAVMLAAGKVGDVGVKKIVDALPAKFGAKDAAFIVDKAQEIADNHKPTIYTPEQAKAEGVSTDLKETPLGQEIVRTAFQAEKTDGNVHVTIDPTSDLKTPAGLPVKVEVVNRAENAQSIAQPEVKMTRDQYSEAQDSISEFVKQAQTPEEMTQAVGTIIDAHKTDLTGLKMIRAQLNKEMRDMSGASGNYYKSDFKHIELMKKDSEVGPFLDAIQKGIDNIDNHVETQLSAIENLKTPEDKIIDPIIKQVGDIMKTDEEPISNSETDINQTPEVVSGSAPQNLEDLAKPTVEGKGTEATNPNPRERVNSGGEPTDSSNGKPEPTSTGSTGVRESVSKLGLRVEQTAIEKKLTSELKDLPSYETMNMADQAKRAADLLKSDPQKAYDIALGKEDPPKGLKAESVFKAVEASITTPEQASELAHSTLVKEASEIGQRIKALDVNTSDSPVEAIKQVLNAREKAIKEKMGKTINQATNDTIKDIQKPTLVKSDLASFVKGIQC